VPGRARRYESARRRGLTVRKVCAVARVPLMTSTRKPQDHSQRLQWAALGTSWRAPAWLDRLNVLVGQWPQSQAFGRRLLCGRGVPSNQSCRRRTARSSATSTPSASRAKRPTPFLCSLALNVALSDATGRCQPGVRTTLPMLRRSARKRWASPALLKGKTFATTGASLPVSRSLSSGVVILCMSPSRRHQLSR